jgi:hypothetical protein
MSDVEKILAEVRARPPAPLHETSDDAWAEWILTPDGTAAILTDEIYGVPPSQRSEIKLDRILKRCNNTRSL